MPAGISGAWQVHTYYAGWVEAALRSSRQALTRRFIDRHEAGVRPMLTTKCICTSI
jgi:hypothetical protein